MGSLFADRERVESILRAEVACAKELYEQERAHFKSVTREVPSSIPYPDSVLSFRQAVEEHNRAIEAYTSALRRFSDYTVRGIVPGDLKP